MDRHSGLFSDHLQEVLDASANASRKGQAQWSTPPELGARLAEGLGRLVPVLVDLNCGDGHLLAAAGQRAQHRLGLDLTPPTGKPVDPPVTERITADLAEVFPLLVDVGFRADAFALNPPWGLHWRRDRFLRNESDPESAHHNRLLRILDPRLPDGFIDSCLATWLVALDRGTRQSEGFILAHGPTWRRLVLNADAPWHSLTAHIWATASFPHWSARDRVTREPTEVIACWWGKSWDCGIATRGSSPVGVGIPRYSLPNADDRPLRAPWRMDATGTTEWAIVANELAIRRRPRPRWNLWLEPDGTIGAHLSTYQKHAQSVPREDATALHSLRGRTPLDLVLRRSEREALQRAVRGDLWTVTKELQDATAAAVHQYHRERAPIVPLPAVQRIGFLDEQDHIQCIQDLSPWFSEGTRYALESSTVLAHRKGSRVNAAGEDEPVEYTGTELVLIIRSASGAVAFLDPRHLAPGTELKGDCLTACVDRRSIAALMQHFEIPDVPDIARVDPQAANAAEALVSRLEDILHRLSFVPG